MTTKRTHITHHSHKKYSFFPQQFWIALQLLYTIKKEPFHKWKFWGAGGNHDDCVKKFLTFLYTTIGNADPTPNHLHENVNRMIELVGDQPRRESPRFINPTIGEE